MSEGQDPDTGDKTGPDNAGAEAAGTVRQDQPETTPDQQPGGEAKKPYELKFPEAADAPLAEKFSALFQESGIPAEAAQKLVDTWAEAQSERTARAEAELTAQIEAWETEVKAMPKHEELLAKGKRVVDFVKVPEFAELVTSTWFGSHPAVVKALAVIGDLLGDDRQIESGRTTNQEERSLADRLFGS